MLKLTGRTNLYLVRHGSIYIPGQVPGGDVPGGRRYIGQIDLPLDAEGIRQAESLRELLRDVPFSRICSSDLSRARHTAEIIAGDRTVEVQHAFREIDLGEWEGRSFAEIIRRFPDAYKARGRDLKHFRPPRGESFGDVFQRVRLALHDILEASSGNVLLVAHRGVNRLILCEALGLPVSNLLRIRQDYGCLNTIAYDGSSVLQLLNYTPAALQRDAQNEQLETRELEARVK